MERVFAASSLRRPPRTLGNRGGRWLAALVGKPLFEDDHDIGAERGRARLPPPRPHRCLPTVGRKPITRVDASTGTTRDLPNFVCCGPLPRLARVVQIRELEMSGLPRSEGSRAPEVRMRASGPDFRRVSDGGGAKVVISTILPADPGGAPQESGLPFAQASLSSSASP